MFSRNLVIKLKILWGTEKVSEYMIEKMQGSMDTSQYNIMLQGFIEQIKWSGSILLGLGGILFITCMTLVLNKRLNSLWCSAVFCAAWMANGEL